jgi:undecaprenyl-diphosphatase
LLNLGESSGGNMMNIVGSFLLGLLQGVTEFLPISSSGHLVLAQELFKRNLDQGITFEVVVHFGSLFSIAIFFRQRLLIIIKTVCFFMIKPSRWKKNWSEQYNVRFVFYVILSMIPAALIGFLMKNYIKLMFSSPMLVSWMLLITGLILYSTKFQNEGVRLVTPFKGFIMGFAQALAVIPGISRSGTTITTGVWLGVKKNEVADFSFLMLLPILSGAMLLEFQEMWEIGLESQPLTDLTVAFFSSLISGLISLKFLIHLFKGRSLHYFSYYCWLVGIFGIIYFGFFTR